MRMKAMTPDDNGDLQEVIIVGKAVDPSERQGGMRLNSEMRNEVIQKAIEHGFGARRAALLKREQDLAKRCWLSLFGAARLKHAKALSVPFVYECTDRYGNKAPDGIPVQFTFAGGYRYALRCQLPLPSAISSDAHWRVKDEHLGNEVREWYATVETLNVECNKAGATLQAMLSKISTYPSLEKNWPAGKPFYKHLPTKYPFRHQVPAVLVEELNAALGI